MASQTDSSTADIKPTLTDLATPVSGVVEADNQTAITKGFLKQMLSELLQGVTSEFKSEIQSMRNDNKLPQFNMVSEQILAPVSTSLAAPSLVPPVRRCLIPSDPKGRE